MTRVHYKPGRLAMWALVWGLGGGTMLVGRAGDGSTLDTAMGIALLAMGVLAGAAAMDMRPALAADCNGLTVRTLFARRTIRWSELLVVTIEQRYLRLWGIVPIARRDYLSFLVQGGAMGTKRMRLLGSWLALPPGGLVQLRETILAARGAAGNAPMHSLPASDGPNDGSEFDPDAAIARYLSAKASEPIAPSPALALAKRADPPTSTAHPARPSFGRRVAPTRFPG
jgi:hypothetical protein